MNKMAEFIGSGVIFIAGIIIVAPLSVALSYFTGWILSIICGDMLADGLNLLLNTTRFQAEQLPILCAALGLISSYFRTQTTVNEKKSKRSYD